MAHYDCEHLMLRRDWLECGDAWVQGSEYSSCDYFEEYSCDSCPHYSPESRIVARVNSPYDCDLEDC